MSRVCPSNCYYCRSPGERREFDKDVAAGKTVAYGSPPLPPGYKLDPGAFYATYHGHTLQHLSHLHATLVAAAPEHERPRCCFLLGDSTMDNKHWFFSGRRPKEDQLQAPGFTAPACNGFGASLTPPRMVQDIAYWMNHIAEERLGPRRLMTFNAAIEESTAANRDGSVLPHDAWAGQHATRRDCVVLSVGGNDIALRPTARTILNMLLLTRSPRTMIANAWAPGFGYFVKLFRDKARSILTRAFPDPTTRPAKALVCVLYYPDETPGGSWADYPLSKLGYDADPGKLQLLLRSLFDTIRRDGIQVDGMDVDIIPMFELLDPKVFDPPLHRVHRVAPDTAVVVPALPNPILFY